MNNYLKLFMRGLEFLYNLFIEDGHWEFVWVIHIFLYIFIELKCMAPISKNVTKPNQNTLKIFNMIEFLIRVYLKNA